MLCPAPLHGDEGEVQDNDDGKRRGHTNNRLLCDVTNDSSIDDDDQLFVHFGSHGLS